MLVRTAPHGGACRVAVWPLPWGGVLCWCVARRMVGRAALLCGPPHGGACCAGAWPPSWWGMLCCCLSITVVVRGVVVPGFDCCRVRRLAAGDVGFGLVVPVVVF